MTPANIAGMARVLGLDIIALTDHNSVKNCGATMRAAAAYGVVCLPGMEMTTQEEIHLVCLFDTLAAAMELDGIVSARLPDIQNRPDIFGEQRILDEEDALLGLEPKLLLNATDIPLEEAAQIVAALGGVCYPAHIDRPSNSVTAALGVFPDEPHFANFEVSRRGDALALQRLYPNLAGRRAVFSSDAHYLTDISEATHCVHLPECSAAALLEKLRG